MSKKFQFKVKVYYEDTDAGGVVYYANYLKYLERARTEAISSIGETNNSIFDKYNILIIVKSCNIEYKKPAKLEDNLEVLSKIVSSTKTSFVMSQNIYKDKEIISEAEVRLVCVDKKGKPSMIPDSLTKLLQI